MQVIDFTEGEWLVAKLPFKDNANDPDPAVGWDGARSARLGASILQPVLQSLRA